MIPRQLFSLVACICLASCLVSPACLAIAGEKVDSEFIDVLEIAGLGEETLADFSDGPDYTSEDWQLLVRLLSRLRQYPTKQLERWAQQWDSREEPEVGNLYEMAGKVVSIEILAVPSELSPIHAPTNCYRCQFQLEAMDAKLVVLTPRVPKRWAQRDLAGGEPVRFRGILLKAYEEEQQLGMMLTDGLAWYPHENVTTGLTLLARNGMDVSLFDDVVHRQPFVKPSVGRESDAFYACLTAIRQVDHRELAVLAQQSVGSVAKKWQKQREPLAKQHQTLQENVLRVNGEVERAEVTKQLKTIGRRLAIAESIAERSQVGVSSVAPLFLQPEQEVGELVRLEGTARRAIWIAETDRPGLDGYYELELFPPDSQDLPVVCCASSLPPRFPIGDKIREPVRISGIFFKSWQYRSRKLIPAKGETKRQQRLYTPIVVTNRPTWLTEANTPSNPWGLWGGIAFLVTLLILWINMARLGRRDRMVRNASRESKVLEIPLSTLSGNDYSENDM